MDICFDPSILRPWDEFELAAGASSMILASGAYALAAILAQAVAAGGPDLIFKDSTEWRALTPDDELATYAISDPSIDGVAYLYTMPEKGGVAGAFGVAEEVSDVSPAYRQVGSIGIKDR